MDTFTGLKPFTANPGFQHQRRRSLEKILQERIDPPIADIVGEISKLPYCYAIQSCCGHFIFGDRDLMNTDPLPELPPAEKLEYRIAFLALCIDGNNEGKKIFSELRDIALSDEEYIQFGCSDWFWNLQVNSYVIQVEPERFRTHDKIWVTYPEALHLELVRNKFLSALEDLFKQKTDMLIN